MAGFENELTRAILAGRRELLTFVLAGSRFARQADLQTLSLDERAASTLSAQTARAATGDIFARIWFGLVVSLLPLMALGLETFALSKDSLFLPGWPTYRWVLGLCGINLVFLLFGPYLWNSYLTVGIEIAAAAGTRARRELAEWIRTKYRRPYLQWAWAALGGTAGMAVLFTVTKWTRSDRMLTVGPAEYFAMFQTAFVATNGFWILWWVVALVPKVSARNDIRYFWHDPARTPFVVAINRALWKVGFAEAIGFVSLSLAIIPLPNSIFSSSAVGTGWATSSLVFEYLAFAILTVVFARDALWGQWKTIQFVRSRINASRAPVDSAMNDLSVDYSQTPPAPSATRLLFLQQMDRHLDSLKSVDLRLGWALTWFTSIIGVVSSVVISLYSATSSR